MGIFLKERNNDTLFIKGLRGVRIYYGDELIGKSELAYVNKPMPIKAHQQTDENPIMFDASYDAIEDKLTLVSEDGSTTATICHPVFVGGPKDKFRCKMELIPENNS